MNTVSKLMARVGVAAALLAGASLGWAATTPLALEGTNANLAPGGYSFTNMPFGSFADNWSFTLLSSSDVTVAFDQLPLTLGTLSWNISTLAGSLASGSCGTGTCPSGFTVTNLSAHPTAYTLMVTGNADGTAGGLYAGLMTVTAVPLPPAAILFGSVLAGLAVVARKRGAAAAAA